MKKRYFALLLLCLLLLSACQKADVPPKDYYKVGGSNEINADGEMIPAMAEILPDFSVAGRSGSYVSYENVTPRALSKYVDKLCDAGFSCEEAMYEYLLYREDLILFITNNTENFGKCTISGYEQLKTANGVTAQEAMAFTDDYVFFLMERSDPELYEQTGLQCFIAPVDIQKFWPQSYGTDVVNKGYTPILYYVGPEGCVCLDSSVGCDATYADLNDNGVQEVITWGYGSSSGVFSFDLYGIELDNNTPTIAYSGSYFGPHGTVELERDQEGRVWLIRETFSKTQMQITVVDNKIVILDENGSIIDGQYLR